MDKELQPAPVRPENSEMSTVLALYTSHLEAERAIRELQQSGCDMRMLSVIGRDYYTEQGVVGFYTSGDQTKTFGTTSTFWGGLWGLTVGSAFVLIPGIGPLFVAGPVAGQIVGEIEDAAVAGGMSALGAALYRIGVSPEGIVEYETKIRTGKYVLIAHGAREKVQRLKTLLTKDGCQDLVEYSPITRREPRESGHNSYEG